MTACKRPIIFTCMQLEMFLCNISTLPVFELISVTGYTCCRVLLVGVHFRETLGCMLLFKNIRRIVTSQVMC